jgi:tRNA-specific 2-thiouridylase
MASHPTRILLGMSGGTDSSVAAMLLQEQGYEVVGVTFRFWDEQKNTESPHIQEARELASQLGIEHHVRDARAAFQTEVIDYFIHEYLAGRTPFPCVKCNNALKWNFLVSLAGECGCEKIATGHYARIAEKHGFFYVAEAADKTKDQTFFLWGLPQHVLQRAVFPLGGYTKPEIREIAAERGFTNVAKKKDSMGICFCPGNYRDFLKKQDMVKPYIKKGNFVDEDGTFLGRHESYFFYTVGQRYGLGINLNSPVFVKEIIPDKNRVVLAPVDNINRYEIQLEDYNLVNDNAAGEGFDALVKIHYRKPPIPGNVSITGKNRLTVKLTTPAAAVAPGQCAVFYKDGMVLGGGIIKKQI